MTAYSLTDAMQDKLNTLEAEYDLAYAVTDHVCDADCGCDHNHNHDDHAHGVWDPTYGIPDNLPEEFVVSGGRWTDGGGTTSTLGGSGGTIEWSLGGAGITDNTGAGFYTGASVDMSTFLPYDFEATLQRAFDAWSTYGDINFVQVADGGGNIGTGDEATIRVVGGFIDGQSGANVLAKAFFPSSNPAGGDMVFDNGNTSFYANENNFFLTALHEIGHAIGLRHEDVSNAIAIMNPSINTSLTGLQPDDIAGVRAVYGAAGSGSPDLIAENVAVSDTTPASGDTITITYDIKNDGDAAAVDTTAGIYVSTDNVITTSDTRIGTEVSTNSNAAGATDSETVSLTLPTLATGTYYIGVIADYNQSEPGESSESNNASAPVQITVSGVADDFTQDTSTSGSVAVGGTSSGNIQFVGDQDWFAVNLTAGQTYVIDLEGSPTSAGTLSDTFLRGIHDSAGNLIPGTTDDDDGVGTNSQLTFTATDTGVHYISAGAFNTGQGTYEVTVTQQVTAQPDLIANNLSLSSTTFEAGDSATLSYDISNQGTGTGANTTAGIYLSTNALITTTDTLLTTEISTASTAIGATDSETVSLALPGGLAAGTYFIGVIADYNETLSESDEGNNVSASAIQITVTDPAEGVTLRNAADVKVDDFNSLADAIAAAGNGHTFVVDPTTYAAGPESVSLTHEGARFNMQAGVDPTITMSGTNTTLTLVGTGGATVNGNAQNNILRGADGNDVFNGFGGDDRLIGFAGNDTLSGGADNDMITGWGGMDSLNGDAGNDLIYGGADNDTVNGGDNNDSLYGGSENDLVNGDGGFDLLVGQNGNDTLNGGAGEDTVNGGGGNDVMSGGTENDTLAGQAGDDTIDGGEGNDQITGRSGADSIDGGGGADNIFGGFEEDTVNGGLGNDTIRGEGQDDLLNGDAGDDLITGGGNRDTINGGDDNDQIYGQGGLDILNGDAGNDQVYGGDNHDIMSGGAGNDSLFGQDGNDRLDGGSGTDQLTGNAGTDTFVFALGYDDDTILSFQPGIDSIEINSDLLTGTGFTTVAEVLDTGNGIATQTNATTVTLDFGAGDVLVVGAGASFTLADLSGGMTIA